jgi:hypothetical protein
LGIEDNAFCPESEKPAAPHCRTTRKSQPRQTDNTRLQPTGNPRHNGQENCPVSHDKMLATPQGRQQQQQTQKPNPTAESDGMNPNPLA